MIDFDYLPKEQLVFDSFADADMVADVLLRNGYVVMMSREDQLYVLNWLWEDGTANRNDVIFALRSAYDLAEYEANKKAESE